MENEVSTILVALASDQPSTAVDVIDSQLSTRVENMIADYASNYRYVVAGNGEPNG